ncbi:MAG: hypothetical protein KatS3mg131_1324 [Candidatus Tectimicrobiota bacterium]|nr:MAG: hypothetical protein KatS3mg131_1324 [Candidatus Tectomicrobia bacterium]
MGLFARKAEATSPALSPEAAQELVVFYRRALRVLLSAIKAFSLDLAEIDADGFKARMDELAQYLTRLDERPRLQRLFERYREVIDHYLGREKAYLEAREAEFKRLIAFLTDSFASLAEDNEAFQLQLYQHSQALEQLAYLDDLRRLQAELQRQVTELRHHLRAKQARDAQRAAALARQVPELQRGPAPPAATTDPLTGAYDRATLERYLQHRLTRYHLQGRSFALLLLDLDDFERLNQRFGSRIGDRVLVALVRLCREFIRQDDFLARYGGEEFALVLPGASLRHGVKTARRLCRAVAAARYRIEEEATLPRLAFTVSIGVSSVHADDTAETLVARAAQALAQAKALGKNRVVHEQQLPDPVASA